MRISASDVSLNSSHNKREEVSVEESMRYWIGDESREVTMERSSNEKNQDSWEQSARELTEKQAKMTESISNYVSTAIKMRSESKSAVTSRIMEDGDMKKKMAELIIQMLTGKKTTINVDIMNTAGSGITLKIEPVVSNGQAQAGQAQAGQAVAVAGPSWGLEYDRIETVIENENTSFSAEGIVKTDDGREINLNLELSMSREYMEQNSISIRAGVQKKLVDPLVVNFSGGSAGLTSEKFDFDLNSDGKKEEVSFVTQGSGFLALDEDENGTVDDGSELFGPSTGDGFEELSRYDEDQNGWIDESDSVYSRLKVWTRDSEGKDSLLSLAETNVGAIYLNNVSTEFSLKNSANELQGMIRTSSVYLAENGGVGTVQQLDLAV